ncbi:MAG: LamG-like jellyroll fold domain-containing protein, partial [Candidatus Thorarchaeota archaeon]
MSKKQLITVIEDKKGEATSREKITRKNNITNSVLVNNSNKKLMPSFVEEYHGIIIKLIKFLNKIDKAYEHHHKSSFQEYVPQNQAKENDAVPGLECITFPKRTKQNKIDSYDTISTVRRRQKLYLRQYEELQKLSTLGSFKYKILLKKDENIKEQVKKIYGTQLKNFIKEYLGLKVILLEYKGDIDIVEFANLRKGYRSLFKKSGYNTKDIKTLESYRDKYTTQFPYLPSYGTFTKGIKNQWKERLEKFFSGIIVVGGREYRLSDPLKGNYTKAKLLLGFTESIDIIKFLKNRSENISVLKDHRYSDSFIQNFLKIIDEIQFESEILDDVFCFMRNENGYSTLLKKEGCSQDVNKKFQEILKQIEKNYKRLTKIKYSKHLEDVISKGEYNFLLEQKTKLKAFFNKKEKYENFDARKRLKRDLNHGLFLRRYLFEWLKNLLQIRSELGLQLLATICYGTNPYNFDLEKLQTDPIYSRMVRLKNALVSFIAKRGIKKEDNYYYRKALFLPQPILLFDLNIKEIIFKSEGRSKTSYELRPIPRKPFKKIYIKSQFSEKKVFEPIGIDHRSYTLTLASHRDLVESILMEKIEHYQRHKNINIVRKDELSLRRYAFDWLRKRLDVTNKNQLLKLATIVYGTNPYRINLTTLKKDLYFQRLERFRNALLKYFKKRQIRLYYTKEELLAPIQVGKRRHATTIARHKELLDPLLKKNIEKDKHNKEEKGKSKVKLKKRATLSQNKLKYAGLSLSILGIFICAFLLFTSSSSIFFPQDMKFLFFLLELSLAFFFFLFFNGWRLLQRRQELFLLISFIPLLWVGYLFFTYGMMEYAPSLPLINICLCYFVSRRSPEIIPKKSHTPLLEKVKNASISRTVYDLRYKGTIAYHKNKFVILWTLLFFISIGFIGVLILAPQFQLICYGLIFGAIILFTFKSTSYIRIYLRSQQKEKQKRSYSRQTLFTSNDKIIRPALLVTVFLTIFPLIFAINSISAINSPSYEFARISPAQRLRPASINFTSLEYSSYLEDLDKLSINDEFVIRCKISPFIGVASLVRVRLIPQDIPPIEGYRVKKYYELSSDYVNGPKNDYEMITYVPLNILHLAPGTYKVEIYYSELTGFGFRTASPQTYQIKLQKDTLEVISNERFLEPLEDGYPYGAVYTFEYNINGTLSWNVIYDGQIVNSLRKPIQLGNLSLFIEEDDYYKNIANISTDREGKFYLNYTVYGSIEQNLMARISWPGFGRQEGFYLKFSHEEYIGLETPILEHRFFNDTNFDKYPDWDFSLSDLLRIFTSYSESTPSSSLVFMAEFNEGVSDKTIDFVKNLEGSIEGNTTWTEGKRESGLAFDGDGNVISGGSGGSVSNWHSESDSEQAITSSSYVEKLTLDFTAPAQGDYFIIVSCEVTPAATGYSVRVRAQLDDTTTMMEALYEGVNSNPELEYKCESTIYVAESLGIGSHSIDIDASMESGTGYMRYARIIVLRLDEWLITSGMYEYAANEGTISLSGAEASYSDVASITFTPDTAGDYLVLASMEMYCGYTGDTICGRISYDSGSEYLPVDNIEESYENYVTYESKDTTDWHSFVWGGIVNMPSSSKTIKVQACRTGGSNGNADVRRRRIIAIRLGAMSAETQSTEDASRTLISSQWTDKSTLQFTPSSQQDYFIIGGMIIKPDSTSYPSHAEFTHTAGTGTGTISLMNVDSKDSGDPADCIPMMGISIKKLNAESQTFKTRYGYVASRGTTYGKGSFIIAVPLSITPTYEDFDYVDFGDVLDSEFNNEFVITSWIYPTSFTNNISDNAIKNVFFSKEGIVELGVNETGFVEIYLNTNSVEGKGTYGFPGAVALNSWNYVSLRFNDSGNDVDVLIGDTWCRSALGVTAEPWSSGGALKEGGTLIIGAEISSYSCFTGILDDISIFNSSMSDAQIESHSGGPFLAIDVTISKADGQGGWTPLTVSGLTIDGWLNFECNSTGKPIELLEFFLTGTAPDLQNPTPEEWNLLASFNYDDNLYSYVEESWNIPDNSSWYFVAKATDDINNYVYDSYSIYFEIDHFDNLINFTHVGIEGRINHNSQIGVTIEDDHAWHISSLDLYVNKSSEINFLESYYHTEITSNYWLINLDCLSDWITNKSLIPNNYEVNFVIGANLTYGVEFPSYYVNYTLNNTVLDIKGPDMELISGSSYTFSPGSTYDNIEDNLLTMAINSTDNDFSYVNVEYKYTTPITADWVAYGSFMAQNSLAEIVLDILEFADDNITLRFTGFDQLSNNKVLLDTANWFAKDFNNHETLSVEGLSDSLYGLSSNDMLDLELKIIPKDNDIKKVIISTSYECFSLENIKSEQNYIYFTDDGTIDPDVQFNMTYFNIFGSDFTDLDISIALFQETADTLPVTSATYRIIITSKVFSDIIQITDMDVNISGHTNNIWMSTACTASSYNNSDGIPFIVNNNPPVLKIYNSLNELIKVISLSTYLDDQGEEIYNTSNIEISDNKFKVLLPQPQFGEVGSIEEILINGTSYTFSYYVDIDDNDLFIKLLTSESLDGMYGLSSPIIIKYAISTELRTSNQFVGSYNFTHLPQDNYTFIGEFYDISGIISTFFISQPLTIDYHGPQIYQQFNPYCSINPEFGTLSFFISDFSGISSYYFNITIAGYWNVVDNIYTFYFNDSSISEGIKQIKLLCNDTLGYLSECPFTIIIDRSVPIFSNVVSNYDYGNNLLEINATLTEISDYNISIDCLHLSSGIFAPYFEYSMIEIEEDQWQILIDSNWLQNGYYNIILRATDAVGNLDTYNLENIYFDNSYPVVDLIEEHIYAEDENIYNSTVIDILYFNDNKHLTISAFDLTYDGFDWSQVDQIIAEQLGIENITMYYSRPLTWYNLSIAGTLNYDQFLYEITGYGDSTSVQNIRSIQSIRIGDYIVDKFTILLDGTSLLLLIDPQFRYALSPALTGKIYAQFYELVNDEIVLQFNSNTEKWKVLSSGRSYFNVTDYLSLTEGDKFLFWLEIEDGFSNILVSHKFEGIYDNKIQKINDNSLFEWYLGTNSTGSGQIIFGSENYGDCTLQIDTSSILVDINGDSDIHRIMIYGSSDQVNWTWIGRAYFSGEDEMWNLYWDGDYLRSINELPPESYFLKCLVFDKAGNFLDCNRHYSSNYGFINDTIGTDPEGWIVFEGGGTVNVISELDGHNKVVEFHDTSSSSYTRIRQTFASNQTHGTIEYWWRIDDATDRTDIWIMEPLSIGYYSVVLSIQNDKFRRYYSPGFQWYDLGKSASDNTWYHIRIDFECSDGGYYGLSEGQWQVYIDGDHYGPYPLVGTHDQLYLEGIYIKTEGSYSDYSTFIDAIGYSWDPDYNIGQNRYEFGYSGVKTYDYTNFNLISNLVFGEILDYNASALSNEHILDGIIENYLQGSSTSLWDVIGEYYDPLQKTWIPLATDSATIQTDGSYEITWDIDRDESFIASMYNFSYEYLPLQIASATSSDLWGSWGTFSDDTWRPIIVSDASSNIDISVYKFDHLNGWEIDTFLSSEMTISCQNEQVFKLFDLNKDDIYEIIRLTPFQIDVLYLNQSSSQWNIKENITNLSGYNYFSFDIEYDGSSSTALLSVHQKNSVTQSSIWLYSFNTDYTLSKITECASPINFEPTSIRILNYFSTTDRQAILV